VSPVSPMEDHLATIWEAIGDELGDVTALEHGAVRRSWREFDNRAGRLAAALLAAGVGHGDTVAIDLYNCNEYLEVFFAALKIRAVPANVNYRYADAELEALLRQSDTRVLVYHQSLADRVAAAAASVPGLRFVVRVDDVGDVGDVPVAAGHHDLEDLIAGHEPAARIHRPEADVFLSYTGGTTGLPKGVEYRVGASVRNTQVLGRMMLGLEDVDWDGPALERARTLAAQGRRPVAIPASPLMHSTGLTMASVPVLTAGGTVVTLTSRSFDADELFATAATTRARTISIVGDAMARPMVAALEAKASTGDPYDTSSLVTMSSAGVAWSGSAKRALLDHIPQATLVDACGSTEGVTIGMMPVRRGDDASTDRFLPGPGLRLIRDDGSEIPQDSDEVGRFVGPTPARGYRGDAERTAATFWPEGEETYAIPGDHGRWNPDGTITLIGRGTSVINTGGEKVFAEEVQEVIAEMKGVEDCAVVGVPDERFGSLVAAVVQVVPSASLDAREVAAAVREKLASYKVPRTVVFAPVPRGPNGKLLYPEIRSLLATRCTA
jgi:3-oxocholest-4-en-26-oate---CoA ligase